VSAYVIRNIGGIPRVFPTAASAARALLTADGPTDVGVLMAGDGRERGLTQSELRQLGRAVREAREQA
jgi:hypothetical protein